MNMREKIARGIYAKRNGVGSAPWGKRPHSHKLPYLVDADAALDALMEPTIGMQDAALPMVSRMHQTRDIFSEMIRAAKEGK